MAVQRRSRFFDDVVSVEPGEALDAPFAGLRGAEVIRDRGLLEWARMVPEPQGPMDFDRFRFQLALYEQRFSEERDGVVKKATQLGVSAWALRWSLYWSDVHGRTGLYVFPTERTLRDFAQHRIATTIRRSEYLRSRLSPESVNNVGLRQIGLGFVYFRGAEETTNLESIPADTLVLDEYDSLRQDNISVAESRVSAPLSAGLIRRVGVPSIPGYGIAKAYERTTQHVWQVRCEACSEWQPMIGSATYEANMDEERARLVCKACRRDLDVAHGEWVATFPERETRGFWISKFVVPGIDLRRVVENHHKSLPADRQSHYNRDLGEEFAPAEGRLSRTQLLACTRPGQLHLVEGTQTLRPVTMGVDVASARAFNVRISEHLDEYTKVALWIGRLEWPEAGRADEQMRAVLNGLGELMHRYSVNMAAIDHLPEGRLARSFASLFPGRVYRIAYDTSANPKPVEVTRVDDDERVCVVHRTTAIDATLESFRHQRNMIPALEELPEEYADHLGNLVRMQERDEHDRIKQFYRSTGPDDFAHAEVYDLMAAELMYRRVGQEELERAQSELHPLAEQLQETEPDGMGDRLEEGEWDGGRDWR